MIRLNCKKKCSKFTLLIIIYCHIGDSYDYIEILSGSKLRTKCAMWHLINTCDYYINSPNKNKIK